MSLLKGFTGYINKENLFTIKDRLLLAVSGGVDSAVLCALCHEAGYDFVIAHCNFRLRGEESERDEAFVSALGVQYGKEVLVKHFDTAVYAAERKVSIQVAARELRYAWFGELLNRQSAIDNRQLEPLTGSINANILNLPFVAYIVTAHHLDDNVETVMMKFFKGTGVAGLRGILPKQGKIVRPLLFARKEELTAFATAHQLSWVEDSSNAQDKYARNYLRHQVVPLLEGLYPEVISNLSDNIARFRDVEVLYQQAIEVHKKKLLEFKGNEVHIPVLKLKRAAPLPTLVYELAKPYGFSAAQTPEIIHLLDSESGRYVASASHRIIRNRNWLIIAPAVAEAAKHVIVEEGDRVVQFAVGSLRLEAGGKKYEVGTSGNDVAFIDMKELHYPLLLRPWKAGDYFYPLGMKKKKKVARFLIDQKVSKTDKENVWVLECNKRIVWVVGMRIDDRFKITDTSNTVIKIAFTPGANSSLPAL
ncbi:MAG: tRNA lysidine(34) synthetase TilS [Niastella sp.]|nr:tRNA lysidine(34) synthetase TilS [Niastella sp.]